MEGATPSARFAYAWRTLVGLTGAYGTARARAGALLPPLILPWSSPAPLPRPIPSRFAAQ